MESNIWSGDTCQGLFLAFWWHVDTRMYPSLLRILHLCVPLCNERERQTTMEDIPVLWQTETVRKLRYEAFVSSCTCLTCFYVAYCSNCRPSLFYATEWSRTATQKINKASKEKTSSFHSSNSNNSSLSFLNHDRLAETQRGIGEYYLLDRPC